MLHNHLNKLLIPLAIMFVQYILSCTQSRMHNFLRLQNLAEETQSQISHVHFFTDKLVATLLCIQRFSVRYSIVSLLDLHA